VRRGIILAARFYPAGWRDRYGEEFDALLEDATADWRQLLNVAHGALTMQLENGITHVKVAGALALAGAILALAASYRVPPRYVASALLQITPVVDPARPAAKEVVGREAGDRIGLLRQGVINRRDVARIVEDRDLYRKERERTTLEDVIEQIGRDMRIEPIDLPGRNGAASPAAFRVSFSYPDKEKAQAVVGELVTLLQQRNVTIGRSQALEWEKLWSQPIPFSESLEVVEPARLPAELTQPRREVFLAWGAAGGLLLGLLVILFRRHPRAGLRVAAFGLAGTALAAGVSLLIPEQYTAKAVLRITAPFDPKSLSGAVPATPVRESVQRLKWEVLNSEDFWETLRRSMGIEGARLAHLRATRDRAFGIRSQDSGSPRPADSSFEIAFSDPDPLRARKVVLQVVSRLQSQQVKDFLSMEGKDKVFVDWAQRHRAGGILEIVLSPVTPDQPATHLRLTVTLAGALLGILLGVVVSRGKASSARPALDAVRSVCLHFAR